MATVCESCSKIGSRVYCRIDAASLCLSCDRDVHCFNALSKRHLRTFLCNVCSVQPAAFSCDNHKLSCHNCDRQSHSNSPQHKRTSINYYTGCPSAEELAELWSCELDGLDGDEKQGPNVPGMVGVDSVGLEGSLDSLLAAGVHAGFAQNLGSWMEPSASPNVDLPSSLQRNYDVNTMIFDSEGSAATIADKKAINVQQEEHGSAVRRCFLSIYKAPLLLPGSQELRPEMGCC